ncbi:nucleotidyltransferase domain-containing protein [candidate division WOR-3 bacterium]|nr:nucleotidyltransferase domain-containing protein [candidate division WOR-3 bacterium]
MNKIKKILYSTNSQKILDFLLSHPDEEFFDRQISKLADVSRSGTNFALRDLAKANIIKREKRGRMCFYSIDNHDFLIKQLKILQSATLLYPLVNKLKSYSLRIVLYGSAAKGENSVDSDIDLFILSRQKMKARNIIFKDPLREKIQYIITTPNDFAKLKKENHVFYKEILNGISLWEQK